MISVTEALQHIESHFTKGEIQKESLINTLGSVLAEDVISPINMPPFKQSSMDGYAIKYSENNIFQVVGEVPAGSDHTMTLSEGEAVRIFTGSRVPDDADTVVMQEHTVRNENRIEIAKIPEKHSNVRPVGEQIKKGGIALAKGTVLNEAAIGFLVGLGFTEASVYKKPKISILITGNELKQPGEPLEEGQVYESNSTTLKLALKRFGVEDVDVEYVKDSLEATSMAIKTHLNESDIVLISGGISVGDYDFVRQGLLENQAQEVFYKINQKPGKPLWFGHKGNTKIFALPGNPASSLSCFYVYVLPLIRAWLGYDNPHLPKLEAIANTDIYNKYGKTLFLKGSIENGKATALTGQASSMLKSFAISNALLIVPSDVKVIKESEKVSYIKLT